MKTEEILNEREKTHGDFEKICELVGKLRELSLVYRREGQSATQQIALEMIYLKIARIICGDPKFSDHWDDIAGYAMLGKGKGDKLTCDCFKDGIGLMTVLCESHAKERREKIISDLEKVTRKEPKEKVQCKFTGYTDCDCYSCQTAKGTFNPLSLEVAQAIKSNYDRPIEEPKEELQVTCGGCREGDDHMRKVFNQPHIWYCDNCSLAVEIKDVRKDNVPRETMGEEK